MPKRKITKREARERIAKALEAALSMEPLHRSELSPKKKANAKRKSKELFPAGYLVQAHQLETGETAGERVAGMKGAITRAAELIRAGYIVEITSTASPAYGPRLVLAPSTDGLHRNQVSPTPSEPFQRSARSPKALHPEAAEGSPGQRKR